MMTQDFLGQLVNELTTAQDTEIEVLSIENARGVVFRGYTISFIWFPEDAVEYLIIEDAPVLDLFTFASTETWRFIFLEEPFAPFRQYLIWGVESRWGKQHFPRVEEHIQKQVLQLKDLILERTK